MAGSASREFALISKMNLSTTSTATSESKSAVRIWLQTVSMSPADIFPLARKEEKAPLNLEANDSNIMGAEYLRVSICG